MNETTQQAIVQTLREKILSGELEPGQRLVEAQAAQWLGVSRTPLRYALSVLSSEGLLERSGARGYVVRRFSVRDVLDAIDVRGALEGLAARCVAERRVDTELARSLEECLREGDAIFSAGRLKDSDEARYEFAGNKTEKVKQIGNAVHVDLMRAHVTAIMADAVEPMREAAE